jgi:hypothetical protein
LNISLASFRPKSRASVRFFEKGYDFVEDEDPYAQIEQKIDSVVNGRVYNFSGISVRSTPPMSYIRTLLPRFSSARNDDSTAIARILCAVHRTPQRIAKFGFIDYKQDSVLSLVRSYYQYLKVNPILTDDDKIILHSARKQGYIYDIHHQNEYLLRYLQRPHIHYAELYNQIEEYVRYHT